MQNIIFSILSQIRDFYGDHAPDGTFFIPFAGSYKKYKGEDRNNNGKNTEVIESIPETNPNDPLSWPPGCFEDLDYDNLWDIIELEIGTDPEMRDTDNDGLSDGEEYYGAYYGKTSSESHDETDPKFTTDPLNPDTDYDGLPDGLEPGRIDGIPPYGNKSGTYTDLGFAYKQSVYNYDSPTYQNALNALTQEENEQYTFEFEDKDQVKRLYPRFIPDDDQNDIRTRTNPLVSDSNTDGTIDGWQDINKNGRYLDQNGDPENNESDSVFGFYSDNPYNLSSNGIIKLYNPVPLELQNSIIQGNSEQNGETTLIFKKGSYDGPINMKLNITPTFISTLEEDEFDISNEQEYQIVIMAFYQGYNIEATLNITFQSSSKEGKGTFQTFDYPVLFEEGIYRPKVYYGKPDYWKSPSNKFEVNWKLYENKESFPSRFIVDERNMEAWGVSKGNILITYEIVDTKWGFDFGDFESWTQWENLANNLRLSGFTVNIISIPQGMLSDESNYPESLVKYKEEQVLRILSRDEHLLWLYSGHGPDEPDGGMILIKPFFLKFFEPINIKRHNSLGTYPGINFDNIKVDIIFNLSCYSYPGDIKSLEIIKDACNVLKSGYYIGAGYDVPDCESDRDMIKWFNYWFLDQSSRELIISLHRLGQINIKPNEVYDGN